MNNGYTARPRGRYGSYNGPGFGTLNRDSEDWKNLIQKKRPVLAFCQSDKCLKNAHSNSYWYRVRGLSRWAISKDVTRDTVQCPNCGKSLFWSDKYGIPEDQKEIILTNHARKISKEHKEKFGFDF